MAAATPRSFVVANDDVRVHVDGDVAWGLADGVATWDHGDGRVERFPYRTSAVMVRRHGDWWWHTHHGSVPDA